MTDQHACGAHAGLGADLRGTALLLLDRVRAVVEPLGRRDGTPPEPGSAGACQACPVCAVLAVLRGERSELATQLAEHATGLIAVLAAVLAADVTRADAGARSAGPRDGAEDDHGARTRVDAPGSPEGAARPDVPERTAAGPAPEATSRSEPTARPGVARPGSAEAVRPSYAPRVPGAHGRSVQRIVVHRR